MRRCTGYMWILTLVLTAAGCSTQKNTAMSRFYHATTARYNAYFNGEQAFLKGYGEQENGIEDNFLEVIDMYPISNEKARAIGTASFDRAIEKAQKCVTLHSIKKRPVIKGDAKSAKNIKLKAKKEYNPFLWHAWMLMADAQMQKGEFLEAAGTYSYISRLYNDEPRIKAEANIKMAQCYSELGWMYEADELFSRLSKDSVPAILQAKLDVVKAGNLLKQQRYAEAIPLLEQSKGKIKNSKAQKIRNTYLLGQLYRQTGNDEEAYRCFQKVINMNPPYRIAFNARIQQTETMTAANSGPILKKLNRMATDHNNRDYLDQVYYAIGNVYLAQADTVKALEMYETGIEKGKTNRAEKGALLLHTAGIYWERADYVNAQRCYSQAAGLIDESHSRYDEVMLRSSSLEELVKYSEEIKMQDSLQYLATLPDAELQNVLDKVILELRQNEEKEALLAEQMEREAQKEAALEAKSVTTNDGSWYFYNPSLLKEGSVRFNSIWGRRRLEDDWRRSDKSAEMTDNSSDREEGDDEYLESEMPDEEKDEAADSLAMLAADPHNKEYYLKLIPFTDEQKAESDNILSEALFRTGVIYKDELEEYKLAENALTRSAVDYPKLEYADDALYNLYLLYSICGENDNAEKVKAGLLSQYPDSRYSANLSDPDFAENILYGRHREDSLYQAAYDFYRNGQIGKMEEICSEAAGRFPNGTLRPKFMFLEASARLNAKDTDGFLNILKQIVENYPSDDVSSLAETISQELRSGKILQSTSLASIWDLHRNMEGADSISGFQRPEFDTIRTQEYLVVLAYPTGQINEDQLLFETASYNFTRYMVRNFGMTFRHEEGISMLIVSDFINFDEAHLYRKRLYDEVGMPGKLEGINTLIITPGNLELLLKYYSFNEYTDFFNAHFLDVPEFNIEGLTIDEEILTGQDNSDE